MSENNRNLQKKIVRGLVRIWVMQKPIVFAAALAIAADIAGVCLVAGATVENTVNDTEVSYEEAPAPVANMSDYADIFGSDSPKTTAKKKPEVTKSVTDEEEDEDEGSPTVLGLNSATKAGYMNNCYFLGDSRLVGMVSYGFVSDSNVLAKVGVSHTAVESTTFTQNCGKQYTVKQYLAEKKPPVVYVCYGVNGMNGISEEKYEKTYKELVEHIIEWAPDSKIVLMSIWPVDDNGRYKGSVKNEWIEKYNKFLLALAEYEGIHYLDVSSVLKGPDGQMKPDMDSGDGLHYRGSAYNTILDYIMHHPVKGISDEGEFKVKYIKPTGEFKKMITEKVELPANAVTEDMLPSPSPEEKENSPTVIATPTVEPDPITLVTPSLSPSPTASNITPSPEANPEPNNEGNLTPSPEETPTPTPGETPTPPEEPQTPPEEPPAPPPEETPTPPPAPDGGNAPDAGPET